MNVGNIQIRPWISVQKTAEARRRNRKLNALSRTLLDKLPADHADKSREPWKTICWRSATMILQNKRIVTLDEDQENLTWHDGWYDFFMQAEGTEDEIRKLAEEEVRRTS